MPKIVKTNSQEAALKDIQDALKIVSSLNVLLPEKGLTDCKIRMTGVGEGKSINETFAIPYSQLLMPLKDYRKKLIAEINQKSKTYSIVLDDSDLDIIDPDRAKNNELPPKSESGESYYMG